MSELPYISLSETKQSPRPSTGTLNAVDATSLIGANPSSAEYLSQRCEFLENEFIKLKEHSIRSRIQIKELEHKIIQLEEAIQGLTAPKQPQAAPFSFSSKEKIRSPFKKAQSIDMSAQEPEINYDNIIPRRPSTTREHLGLFGSLGASSQTR